MRQEDGIKLMLNKNMIKCIKKFSNKPVLYEKGTDIMWVDPYIQKHLLEAHLNPNHDAASRKPEKIEETIEWILKDSKKKSLKYLDLGCGPGLYTSRMAKIGHLVAGLDFSDLSIKNARNYAKENKLVIDYIVGDYLKTEFKKDQDLITLIYCDFGVLNKTEQHIILKKVFDALTINGVFVMDAYNPDYLKEAKEKSSFEIEDSGFWRPHPCLVLNQSYLYEVEKATLEQHIVIDDQIKVYRFNNHYYSNDEMIGILESIGFEDVSFNNYIASNQSTTFYKAVKKNHNRT